MIDGGSIMAQAMPFAEVLDAADQLSPVEQEELIAILHRRLAQAGRLRVAGDIREASQEFEEGRCKPVTPEEVMGALLS